MYQDLSGARGLQWTHINTLKQNKQKILKFTVRGGFLTFWAILDHSAPPVATPPPPLWPRDRGRGATAASAAAASMASKANSAASVPSQC